LDLASAPDMLRDARAGERRALRALLVAYQFPPSGGVGVGRVLKLCKFLPEHGVKPAVVTASNPSVPLRDDRLGRDAHDIDVLRVPTLEPGYQYKQLAWADRASQTRSVRGALLAAGRALLVPDAQVLWQPAAQLGMARLLRRGYDLVFISAPPFSQFLLAPSVRLSRGTAVVLDYRDEWSTYRASFEMMGRFQAFAGSVLEPALLRAAHLVTTVTEESRRELLARFSFLDQDQVVAIPNGYDPDDFPAERPEPPTDRFVLTYAGTVYALNRSPGLLGALRIVHREQPELARMLRVRFIGRIVDTEIPWVEGMARFGVERVGFMPKDEALRALAESHMVLCMFDDCPGTERMCAGKLFELMYLGRPVLVLAPRGAMTDLCEDHRLGWVAPPRDEAAIARVLVEALRGFRAGTYRSDMAPHRIERYHRRQLAGEFARTFREAVRRARG
jgi:glycosyltransferase involved in cell wall biosynthesis